MYDRKKTLEAIHRVGIVPVIRAASPEKAIAIAEAVRAGGVNILEITMTVPGAIEAIRELAERYGDDVVLGAGSVIEADAARDAVDAGARFIVGPAIDHEVIAACRKMGVPCCPGALTPSEVLEAWRAGADVIKIFPAGNVGGPNYIRALKAPLPQIELMPTGGVNLDTAADFIRAGSFALGVGSALVNKKAVADGDYGVITDLARRYVEIVREARGA